MRQQPAVEVMARLLGAVVVAAVFLLVNAGYVYKTTCPLPSGGAQSSWTYGIDDILPYIRTTSSPCKSHTGTRLVLSAIGVDRIGNGTGSRASERDVRAAAVLGGVTRSLNREYTRERRDAASLKKLVKDVGANGPGVKPRLKTMMNGVIKRTRTIKAQLDAAPEGSDSDLVAARRLLGQWFAYQLVIDAALTNDPTQAQLNALERRIGPQFSKVVTDLRATAVAFDIKYPGVADWGFLSSTRS